MTFEPFLTSLQTLEIVRLGRRMQIRQQALATAQLYLRRFYTRVQIRDTNPYLVLATCVYLACKMEECPQHIRVVTSEARTFWPGKFVIENSIVCMVLQLNISRLHFRRNIQDRRM